MKLLYLYLGAVVVLAGCITEPVPRPVADQPPSTFFWIFPDSTIKEGNSKQRIHWWGEDPDGVVVGYLFASGKFLTSSKSLPHPDTIAWVWTTATDSVLAFPLLVKRDTFDIAIRAVDNQFKQSLPDTGTVVIRFTPSPYWDVNGNGKFDSGDVALPALARAADPKGAVQPVPILNQPPSVVFAPDPNNPAVPMQQPETTFTAATFSWAGTDPDGDQTIAHYEFALNDTGNTARWFSVTGNVTLVTLVVPRTRSDRGFPQDTADVYKGTFQAQKPYGPITFLGTIPGLRLNNLNRFFLRARDIAGDASQIVSMPDTGKHWYVKNPQSQSKLLVVSDFITNSSGRADSVIAFYRDMFGNKVGGQFSTFELLDVARGLTFSDKRDVLKFGIKFGVLVPPFTDPAMTFTLHLFDVVYWYTDIYPNLAVAQFPLSEYVNDNVFHRNGKVIFSTMFALDTDPRGALKDFAPIDSVSSADLVTTSTSGSFLFPRLGDTQIPGGYLVYPDSSEASDIFPTLQFKNVFSNLLFVRPIYKRADARYIYRMQDYLQPNPSSVIRYDTMLTLNEFRSLSVAGAEAWACGAGGVIFYSWNLGSNWVSQTSGVSNSLQSIQFVDANNGWCVGDAGTILQTYDGGSTWNDRSFVTDKNLNSIRLTSLTTGVVVGSSGLIIRTTDGGNSWASATGVTAQNLYALDFVDSNHAVAVGDTETVIRTTDGGVSWQQVHAGNLATPYRLNSVRMLTAANGYAVGANGTVLGTTDSGKTWTFLQALGNSELRSIFYLDQNNGWICATSGVIYRTTSGGIPRTASFSTVTQNLNGIAFSTPNQGLVVGGSTLARTSGPGGGVILQTETGGSAWLLRPHGSLNVGVISGDRGFVYLALPLHLLNGNGTAVQQFLQHVLYNEFGF